MALIHCNFYSETLGVASSMDVIVPQASFNQVKTNSRQIAGGLPVLYLLHGMSDDHTIWQRRTSIERYVTPLDIIVVMPAVNRVFIPTWLMDKILDIYKQELPFIVKDFSMYQTRRYICNKLVHGWVQGF